MTTIASILFAFAMFFLGGLLFSSEREAERISVFGLILVLVIAATRALCLYT